LKILGRWAKFNVVGWIGALIQLAVLTLLVRGLQLDYLLATLLAVEAAVLHNFAWHERWTWAGSGSSGCPAFLNRLMRFHLANGLTSIAGNLLLMGILVGHAHLSAVTANLCSILICSSFNFLLSHFWVFRQRAER
jgi:dolichol-phosphate mannosyltransferase